MRLKSSPITLHLREIVKRNRARVIGLAILGAAALGVLGAMLLSTSGRGAEYLIVPFGVLVVLVVTVWLVRSHRLWPRMSVDGRTLRVGGEEILLKREAPSVVHVPAGAYLVVGPPWRAIPVVMKDFGALVAAAGWSDALGPVLESHQAATQGHADARQLYTLGLYELAHDKLEPSGEEEAIRLFYLIARMRLSPSGVMEVARMVHGALPNWPLPLEDALRIALAMGISREADSLFSMLDSLGTFEELDADLFRHWWQAFDSGTLPRPPGSSFVAGLIHMGNRTMKVNEDGSFTLHSGGRGTLSNYVAVRVMHTTTGPSEVVLHDALGRTTILDSGLQELLPMLMRFAPHLLHLNGEGLLDRKTRRWLRLLKERSS